jgi:hypothetical protein
MGIDPGILFPFGDHVDENGNLKAGGKGILRYVFPFGDNVDSNGNVKPRGGKNPVRPSQAGGVPTMFPDLRGSVTPGSSTPAPTNAAEGDAFDAAEAFRPGAGYPAGVTRPQDYEVNPGGRSTTTTNANGVTQTGKQLSPGVSAAFVPEYANSSFNDLLAAQGNQRYNGFNSSQLPETQNNPFSGTAPKTQSFNTEAESVTGNSLADFGGDGSAAFAQSRERTANDTFNPDAARIEGGSSRKPGGSLSDALADTAGINSYMEKFSSGDRQRAASRAFLDGTDSYDGLRKRDAVNGVVYAGGQHYIDGGEGNPAQRLEDPQNARDIASGKAKAQDFLNNKKAEVTAAAKQEPTTLENAASSQAFQQDKPMSATMPSDIGGKTEYYTNNDNVVEPFGAPKGYKSGFKRIDTSMPNGFAG